MQVLSRVTGAWAALAVIAAAMMCGRAQASLMTDSFSFDNLSSNGQTVTGTFTYDTSSPTVVTDLTLDWGTTVYDTAGSVDPAVLPTFDGSELVGPFSMDQIFFPIFEDFLSGTFGPGANGSISDTYTYVGLYQYGGDSVSGPITYDLNGVTGGGSSVPLPAGALGGGLAMLVAIGCRLKWKGAAVV